tara:strand:+ start:5183 stop:6088 length:906 start_codon:yes stop_codon:yes gene_type:complete
MKNQLFLLLIAPFILIGQQAQNVWPPEIKSDVSYIYKKTDDIDLNLWVFNPPKSMPNDSKPAIVFFFGGGWRSGSPAQFVQHCKYLSARGIVSIVADYRVLKRNNTKAIYCLKDAKSAIRWVRKKADLLGIDPQKIIASGGSAGGHLAAATGTIDAFDEEYEDQEISSKPNAMILFNPVVITASTPLFELAQQVSQGIKQTIGIDPFQFSPYNFIDSKTPPTLIFHGDSDGLVPHETVVLFDTKMKMFGNICRLYLYEGEDHAFFNYGRKSNGPFVDTIQKLDQFLVDIGYLNKPPNALLK